MDHDAATKHADDANVPSCESCRRRKLKCGRQQPTCTNCKNFNVHCVYNFDKKKPGLKIGAVESLSRRLEVVEAALSRQEALSHHTDDIRPNISTVEDANQHSASSVNVLLSSLTRELHNLTNAIATSQSRVSHEHLTDVDPGLSDPPRKRKRTQANGYTLTRTDPVGNADTNSVDLAKDSCLLDSIVDAYFRHVQPWLSIIHEPSFREQFRRQQISKPMDVIIRAMTVATLSCVEQTASVQAGSIFERVSEARQHVISTAMDTVCIEHVQALLILAYADIFDGNIRRAMSLLGMITRQLEIMNMHKERLVCSLVRSENASHQEAAPLDWISQEEERRVFWNVYILDRLCAVLTGCNEGVSGLKMLRKLPACASFWYTNRQMATPYLSIHHPVTADHGSRKVRAQEDTDRRFQVGESAWKGSLAFFIETVESMGTIFSYLCQNVSYSDRNDISRWLKSFWDLDKYLVRWKVQLPQQWADSGISRYVLPGIMDPVMAEANALHNTNVILLHERIAYPEPELRFVQLPSSQSASTCYSAALEVCSIICRFLQQRKEDHLLGPYFGFCAFISGRNLLIYSQHHTNPPAEEFWHLIEALESMARRAQTLVNGEFRSVNLFSRFARRLRDMYARTQVDPTYRTNPMEPLYGPTTLDHQLKERHWLSREGLNDLLEQSMRDTNLIASGRTKRSFEGIDLHPVAQNIASPSIQGGSSFALPATQQQTGLNWDTSEEQQVPNQPFNNDDLFAVSQALIDPDFTSLDRILSFDDMLLGGTSDGSGGWRVG